MVERALDGDRLAAPARRADHEAELELDVEPALGPKPARRPRAQLAARAADRRAADDDRRRRARGSRRAGGASWAAAARRRAGTSARRSRVVARGVEVDVVGDRERQVRLDVVEAVDAVAAREQLARMAARLGPRRAARRQQPIEAPSGEPAAERREVDDEVAGAEPHARVAAAAGEDAERGTTARSSQRLPCRAVADDLHVAWSGAGEPVLLVHGSFTPAAPTFAAQAPLADEFRVGLLDRRGFGANPDVERVDFERDAEDIAALLVEPTHLVGHSYGGVGCLLAAAARPESVRSLTVIEPPAFAVAAGDPVRERAGRPDRGRLRGRRIPFERYARFVEAWGFPRPSAAAIARRDVRALVASAGERLPAEATIPLAELAAAPYPKLVVSGDWDDAPPVARRIAGRAFGRRLRRPRAGARRRAAPDPRNHPLPAAGGRRLQRPAARVHARADLRSVALSTLECLRKGGVQRVVGRRHASTDTVPLPCR